MIRFGILFMWLVAALGCVLMKKISPDTKWYPAYAFGVYVLATVVIAGMCAV